MKLELGSTELMMPILDIQGFLKCYPEYLSPPYINRIFFELAGYLNTPDYSYYLFFKSYSTYKIIKMKSIKKVHSL